MAKRKAARRDRPRRALPKDVYPDSLSRFPLLTRELLDEVGRKLYDTVVGPQSRTLVGLRGPGGIWLHSPKLAGFVRSANQYLRFETALDRVGLDAGSGDDVFGTDFRPEGGVEAG